MDNQQEPLIPNTKNKSLIIFGIISGIVAIIVLAVVGALFLNAPQKIEAPDKGNQEPAINNASQLTVKDIPNVTEFLIESDEGSLTAEAAITLETLPTDLYIEYRLENANKRVIKEGIFKTTNVNENIPIVLGENSITLKMRASNTKNYSSWETVDSKTFTNGTAPVDTNNKREVNPNFFETKWALKTDTSEEALKESLQAAYGIKEPLPTDVCYVANSDTVSVGEIFPPQPSYMEDLQLSYVLQQAGEKDFLVQYLFCEAI